MMLAGRTLLITGAARGLGREIARTCAAEGARLVLADIDLPGVQATAETVGARAVPVDLGDAGSISALAASIAA
ncbi:MAG: SDR family oxidoreductase, partial [Rhodobacteraceae bacterium]|nr:SDR family oxidoreductase [Paracoccaceae bacterium]